MFSEGTRWLDPKYFSTELDYFRRHGMDVSEGEELLEKMRKLKFD